MKKLKIAVGMSGGVDSTVAAYILKKKGYDVVGITMSIWDGNFNVKSCGKGACYGPDEKEEIKKTKEIAKKLEIPHFTVNLKKEYKKTVLDYFCSQYLCGKTPNPCVVCNSKVKFGFLLEKAKETGIDFNFFATGHYVQTHKNKQGQFFLKKGKNEFKDQSYFLWMLKQKQIKKLMFPLGNMTKEEVRKIAVKAGFKDLAAQAESQDFIEGDNYSALFKKSKIKEGNICDKEGNILAKHKGIIYYTIGQRRGIGLSGTKKPVYVVDINAKENTVVVGQQEDLYSKEFNITQANWVVPIETKKTFRAKVKIRSQHQPIPATIKPITKNKARVILDKPEMSITLGQSAVFYKRDILIGGGIIEK